MKKYVEKVDRWKTLKVLSCLGNFLKNHKGIVNDNDLFLPITDFMEDFDWQKQIKDIYPAATIKRMEKNACSCRLDFDDSPNEILRCVWNAKFARERLRLFLTNEIIELRICSTFLVRRASSLSPERVLIGVFISTS